MLRLTHNGILLNIAEEKTHEDITDVSFSYLNEYVTFDDNVTLRDLFLVIEKNVDIYDVIFRNWLKEHVHAALYSEKEPEAPLSVNDKLEHVELRWNLSHDEEELDIPNYPDFDGFSIASENDEYYEKGQIIRWGLDFTPVQNYIDIPFKLNNTIAVYNEKTKSTKEYKTNLFTLYQIILGVIWEVSFLGSPQDRDSKKKEIDEQIEDIKSGKMQVYPLEEILGVFKETVDEDEEL